MTMKDTERENSDTFTYTVGYEVYLKGREEPMRPLASFEIRKEVFEDCEQPLERFMDIITRHVLATIDVVGEHRFILSDEKYNKTIALTDQIQAISIYAPEEEHLLSLLER